MNGFKIPEVENLGRVLTKEELKAIIGGAEATVTCTCTLHYKVNVNGHDYWRSDQKDPKGVFGCKDECNSACEAKCEEISGCDHAESHYSFYNLGGSNSGS